MADNKSSEGKVTTLQCMVCNFREVFTECHFKFTDGLVCLVCDRPVMPMVTKPGEAVFNRKTIPKRNDKVANLDCSEALKGLKAIQRDTKKATTALKEFDDIKKHTCPKCDTISLDINTLTAERELYKVDKLCMNCGWKS